MLKGIGLLFCVTDLGRLRGTCPFAPSLSTANSHGYFSSFDSAEHESCAIHTPFDRCERGLDVSAIPPWQPEADVWQLCA